MSLTLNLPPDLEDRLQREAERCGKPAESVALRVLDEHLPRPSDPRRAAAVAMLQGWMEEDACLSPEEASANAAVLRSLDEDRPSHRKLFASLLTDSPK
jgi:hypothetical protein